MTSIFPLASVQRTDHSQSTSNAKETFVKNFDAFLSILTTQLSNQNPLSPLDTHKFTEQLVQFAGVEQQLAQRDSLNRIEAALSMNAASYAVNYIGTTVSTNGATFETRRSFGEFSFKLPQDARQATLEIFDKDNKRVHQADLSDKNRDQWFLYQWDGLVTKPGEKLPEFVGNDKLFTARITATNRDGDPVTAAIKGSRLVTNVDMRHDNPLLGFSDGTHVALSDVDRISL